MFAAGINTNKVNYLFSSIGIIAPTKKLHQNYQKLKPFIMDMSKIKLKKNRIDHYSVIMSKKDYSGDILFEKNNIKYSYSSRSIAIDGAGSTRTCNHRIRGNQNCLVVLSLIKNKKLC